MATELWKTGISVVGDRATEQMMFALTEEQLEKFATGKSVEIKLGGLPGRRLKPEVLQRLQELLSLAQD